MGSGVTLKKFPNNLRKKIEMNKNLNKAKTGVTLSLTVKAKMKIIKLFHNSVVFHSLDSV